MTDKEVSGGVHRWPYLVHKPIPLHPLPLEDFQAAWAASDIYHMPLIQHEGEWARALAPAAEAGAISRLKATPLPHCQLLNKQQGHCYYIRATALSPADSTGMQHQASESSSTTSLSLWLLPAGGVTVPVVTPRWGPHTHCQWRSHIILR